jgi:hypothetical protein
MLHAYIKLIYNFSVTLPTYGYLLSRIWIHLNPGHDTRNTLISKPTKPYSIYKYEQKYLLLNFMPKYWK